MAQYLISCSCGQKVRVDAAQAGGQISCACGQQLTVPTLRGLRALESAPPDKAAIQRAAGRRWSPLQGGMFSVGLLVAVVSLCIVAYTTWGYVNTTPYAQDLTTVVNDVEAKQIDQLSPLEALDIFDQMRNQGLGVRETPPWVHFQHVMAEQRALMIGSGIAAALGLLAAIGALFLKPAQRAH